jgi:EF-P beta-lysylation protein EpmB
MITASPLPRQPSSWQQDFASAITDPAELAAILDLPATWVSGARHAAEVFGLRVPRSFVARMRVGDPHDPLLRQVLPLDAELDAAPGFELDPLHEAEARRAPGLLQKYRTRALLVVTGACAMHCRYCFRREYPYETEHSDTGRWREAIAAIGADSAVREVILSGGDPLSLGNARLGALTQALASATRERGGLDSLRIHTRNAIVLPSRVDAGLLEWLRAQPWRVTVVLHVNHPHELSQDALDAVRALHGTGAQLLNQTVLLAGVNDDPKTLAELSWRLHRAGVLPYYLHLTDAVRGTAHFAVDQSRGIEIVDALARELPGYLVPRLVREIPGEEAKFVVAAGLRRARY